MPLELSVDTYKLMRDKVALRAFYRFKLTVSSIDMFTGEAAEHLADLVTDLVDYGIIQVKQAPTAEVCDTET